MSTDDPDNQVDSYDGWLLQLQGIFTRNLRLKTVALMLTFAVYFWVGRDRETQIIVGFPLSLQVPESRVVTDVRPDVDRVKIRLRGRSSTLNRLNQSNLRPVTVEVDPDAGNNQEISLTPAMVSTPPGTDVVSLDPSYLEVDLERRITRDVTIAPQTSGQLRNPYELGELTVDPDTVTVSGPRSALDTLESVPTEPIDLDGRTETFQTDVRLRPTDRSVTNRGPSTVTVRVPIQAETKRRQFTDLPVEIVNTTRPAELSQTTVDVTVEGPRELVDELDASSLHGSIDLGDGGDQPPGTYEKKVAIRNLPDDVQTVRVHPTHFLVTIDPAE